MKIALASDHGGAELKAQIKKHLEGRGFETLDLGVAPGETADYPIYGRTCGESVASGEADLGMVFCGTGIGVSIAANKVRGIRCAVCVSVEMAEMAKRHNDANMISLGGRILDHETAAAITDAWLDAAFEGGRHSRRVDMLNGM
jgi:ribose 5-phosphate isomerase B